MPPGFSMALRFKVPWKDLGKNVQGCEVEINSKWFVCSSNHKYVKGIKNGCPCIVEIWGTQGCALVGDPARAVGECRDVAKAQP